MTLRSPVHFFERLQRSLQVVEQGKPPRRFRIPGDRPQELAQASALAQGVLAAEVIEDLLLELVDAHAARA